MPRHLRPVPHRSGATVRQVEDSGRAQLLAVSFKTYSKPIAPANRRPARDTCAQVTGPPSSGDKVQRIVEFGSERTPAVTTLQLQ